MIIVIYSGKVRFDMKKFLILFSSFLFISSYAIADDDPFLYKQTDSNTVNTKQTTTVKLDKKGNVYSVKSTKNNSGYNTSNSTNTPNDSQYDYSVQTNTEEVSKNVNKEISGTKRSKNVKNISGSKSDYLIVPSNTDVTDKLNKNVAKINDPYVIKINGTKYYMVKNSATGVYTLDNIVGYCDEKTSLFNALNKINSDNDNTKLTKEELKAAQIRFVAVDNNGRLQLNNKSKDFVQVEYIDLSTTRESINNGKIGSFGYYDVYIKDLNGQVKKIIGYVSFDSDDELLEMIK